MQSVPVDPVAAQTFTVILANQNCQISIFQKLGTVYLSLSVNNQPPIIASRQCENGNRLVRYAYLGFVGDLMWVDTQGNEDPIYTGMGTRFLLQYLEASDLAALNFAA
jgi:hypothetical protein